MRSIRVSSILPAGLIGAIVNAALLGVDQAIRAFGPASMRAPQGHPTLTIAFFASVALVTLAVGYRVSRDAGRLKAAMWAGALAVGLPAALLGILSSVRTATAQSNLLQTDIPAIIIITCLGVLAGLIVAAIGGLVGWARYRRAHREEVAAQAAQRAIQRARPPKRKLSAQEKAFQWLMVAAIVLVTIAPMGLSNLALDNLGKMEGLATAAGALLVGFVLLRLANDRAHWQGYLYDFVGLTLIVSGLIVGIGEITGDAILLLAAIGPMVYIWREVNRPPGVRKPSVTQPPEPEPVLFRNDGESIVVYPSRRKLAGHALFSSVLVVVMGGLAYVFRASGPILVLGLGAFALMGLLFGLIPDLARLLHPWPTLTVTSDGVIDRGSGLVTGFGLIPWHEIYAFQYRGKISRFGFSLLIIIPVSFQRLLARQSRLKRPLLRLTSSPYGGAIVIISLYLAQPPSEVATRIVSFAQSHAPIGFLEQEDIEGNEGAATQHATDDPAG